MPQKVYLDDNGDPIPAVAAPKAKVYLDDQGNPMQSANPVPEETGIVAGVKRGFENLNPLNLVRAVVEKNPEAPNPQMKPEEVPASNAQYEQLLEHLGDHPVGTLLRQVPILGPWLADMAERFPKDPVGTAAEAATTLAAPEALLKGARAATRGRVPGVNRSTVRSQLNPKEAAAVAFGDSRDIPVDLATRSGSRFVRATQKLLGNQPGGAGEVTAAQQGQAGALTKTAGDLTTEVEPRLPSNYTPETAGTAVQDTLKGKAARFGDKAGDAYDQLRQFEANPKFATTVVGPNGGPRQVPLATDMRGVKQALTPIYNELQQRLPIAQQQANPGMKAIQNILEGEDFVPASVAEGNLGALKGIARSTNSPQAGRLAVKAIDALDGEVKAAVAQAGPEAIRALERGRALTKAKYGALDLSDTLRTEPVELFRQLTAPKDAHINLLRKVAKQAPQDMPKVGKAFLEGLFDDATKEGGFRKADTLKTAWDKLGNESKALLFKDPGLVQQLDEFFLLAKRLAENPNPSNSAAVAWSSAGTAASYATGTLLPIIVQTVGSKALARLLYSPKTSAALMKGIKVSMSGDKVAAAAAVQGILNLAARNTDQSTAIPELLPAH